MNIFLYELKKNNGRSCFTLTGILVSITPMKLVRSFLVQITQSWGKSLYDFFCLVLSKSLREDCQVCVLKIKRKIFVGFSIKGWKKSQSKMAWETKHRNQFQAGNYLQLFPPRPPPVDLLGQKCCKILALVNTVNTFNILVSLIGLD